MGVFKRKSKDGMEGETWYVDFYDPLGRRIIKAIGPSKREAEAYLGKVKASKREGRFFNIKKENKTTFNELLNSYIEKVQDQKYFNTSVKYFIPVLKDNFGDKLLSEITYKGLEDFRDKGIKGRRHLLNMEPREVKELSTLKWQSSVIFSVRVLNGECLRRTPLRTVRISFTGQETKESEL